MDRKKAIMIVCFVALLWSMAGLNIKMIVWDSFAIAGARCLVAGILLHLYLMKKELKIKIDKYVIGGAISFIAFNYCFILSTKLTTSATAIMMQYTAPIYVAILSYVLFKEKITKVDIICMSAVFGGMVLFFVGQPTGSNLMGNLIAICNGITFAAMVIFLRLQKNGTPEMSIYLGNLGAGIIGLPFIISKGLPDAQSILFVIIAGILSVVTYTLYAKASSYLTSIETVLIPVIDPILNPVWVFIFLGENPGINAVIGSIIVLAAVTFKVLYGIRLEKLKCTEAKGI